MRYLAALQSRAHLRVALLLLAAGLFLAAGGCGSEAPNAFPAAQEADVPPKVVAAMEAWIEAQRDGDEEALEALYVHDYHYNGMTAHEMAHVGLLPETPGTRVTSVSWRLLAAPEHHDHVHAHQAVGATHDDHECDHDHHATVMARVHVRGVVSASIIADLATEPADDDHDHVHAHSTVAAAHGDDHAHVGGTVGVSGTLDVVFHLVWNHGEPAFIAEQRFETAALELGGGMAATVLRDIHIHPEDAHPGETLDVHGRYAMLPPGGIIRVRVGSHEPVEAECARGELHAHLDAPHHAGAYLVRVEAYAGSVQSRTASLSIAEREVHVDDHQHHH